MNKSNNPTAIRSQQDFTKALITLMQTIPYEEISVKQILIESKLSRKTFYRNFDDKDDLLDSYIDSLMQEYKTDLEKNNNYKFTSIMYVVANFISKNKDKLEIIWKNNLEYLILKKINSFIIATHYTLKGNHTRIDDYIVMLNNGAIWNVMNEWMQSGMKDPIDEILAELSNYLLNVGEYDLSGICTS